MLLLLAACSADPTAVRQTADRPATTPRDDHDTSPYDPPAGPTGTSGGDCPDGIVCVDALPFVHQATTSGGSSSFDAYSCAPDTDESGPEVVYRVTITEAGFLSATLSGLGDGVDVDVHVLGSLDADDCIDRGHWEGASWVEPGTWWVVADSWVDDQGTAYDGAYTLQFNEVLPEDLAGDGLESEVLDRGLWAFDKAWKDGDATRLRIAIGDFDRPSDEPRFWLVDLATSEPLYTEYVSHGEGSSDPRDPAVVAEMSNVEGSHMSSVGVMRASESFQGEHGLSLMLDGLEPGFNDQVRPRAIILHNASYATEEFVDDYGYLGQSWGCAVVDPDVSEGVIAALEDGGVYLSNFSNTDWLDESDYLR
jgi:hypothetical protein